MGSTHLVTIKGNRSMPSPIFHLSIPVKDLESTRDFYVRGLGCEVGRESTVAMTLNFRGHQIVAHVNPQSCVPQPAIYPRHFGLVCESETEWQEWRDRILQQGLTFFRQPKRRFPDTPLEHLTFFLEDPSHNLLEFKYYVNSEAIFGEREFTSIGDSHERDQTSHPPPRPSDHR